uniref:Putative conserved plasma membrane protein n=1 Tax=Corethrella appendiculata TaxID=1370023 RepID=U5ESB7_9DIPT
MQKIVGFTIFLTLFILVLCIEKKPNDENVELASGADVRIKRSPEITIEPHELHWFDRNNNNKEKKPPTISIG